MRNKSRLKAILSALKGIDFRHLPDPAGDTATFLAFFLPTSENALAFKELAGKIGVGLVLFLPEHLALLPQLGTPAGTENPRP